MENIFPNSLINSEIWGNGNVSFIMLSLKCEQPYFI